MCVPRHPRRRVFSAGHNMVVSVPFPIPTIPPSGFPGATSSVSPRPMRPRDHCRFDELPPTRCPVVVQVRFEPAALSCGGSHGDRARQRAQVPEGPFLGRFGTLPAFSVARRKSEAIRCALLARPLGGEPRKVCGCALPSEPLRQCYITSLPRGGPAGQRTHYFTPTLQLRRNAPAKNARSHSALVSRSGFPSHNKTEGPFVPAYGRLRSIFLMKPRKFGI